MPMGPHGEAGGGAYRPPGRPSYTVGKVFGMWSCQVELFFVHQGPEQAQAKGRQALTQGEPVPARADLDTTAR
jgi:hypothetical protein